MGAGPCTQPITDEGKTEALEVGEDQPHGEESFVDPDLQALEETKQITKEAFQNGLLKILNLSIEGYPKAIRSTASKRNELLRKCDGDQDQAVERIKDRAAAIKQEAKTWFLGLVPYVGLPATLLWPTWKLLQRVCLLAAIYGHDVSTDETKAKIISVFGGLRAVPAGEHVLETATQLVWVAFAGPVAGFLPVGLLVNKVTNVEGHLTHVLAKETFEGVNAVPPEVYMVELDPEPSWKDYQELAKDSAQYALVSAWTAGGEVVDIAWDPEKRQELVRDITGFSQKAAEHAKATGRGIVAAAPGAAEEAGKAIQDGVAKAQEKVKETLAGGGKK